MPIKLTKKARKRKQRLRKLPGTPAGTLEWTGDTSDASELTYLRYNDEELLTETLTSTQAIPTSFADTHRHILLLTGLSDITTVQAIGKRFGVHPLALEDILNVEHRTKAERYPNPENLFLVLKAIRPEPNQQWLTQRHCCALLYPEVIVIFAEEKIGLITELLNRIDRGERRLRRSGTDFIAYVMLDLMVDHYLESIHAIEDRIEALEDAIWNRGSEDVPVHVQDRKRELMLLRKAARPLREVFTSLNGALSEFFSEGSRAYLKDVQDHLINLLELIEIQHELLAETREMYLNRINERTNAVMKVLTLVSTIFLPLNFLAGMYGMNFEAMPFLQQPWAFYVMLSLMVSIAFVMLGYFWRKGWW